MKLPWALGCAGAPASGILPANRASATEPSSVRPLEGVGGLLGAAGARVWAGGAGGVAAVVACWPVVAAGVAGDWGAAGGGAGVDGGLLGASVMDSAGVAGGSASITGSGSDMLTIPEDIAGTMMGSMGSG